MHEKICDIQNSIWKAYTEYRKDKDIAKYQNAVIRIEKKYEAEPLMFNFCQNILFSWVPIINEIKRLANQED